MPVQRTTRTELCAHCGAAFTPKSYRHAYCRVACQGAAIKARNIIPSFDLGDVQVTKGTRGAISELRVAVDLMSKGFHVFRAMSSSCPCDLVVWKSGGPFVKVEVKSASKSAKDGAIYRQPSKRNEFDVICHATLDELVYEPPIEEW
jgi:hypothetical protein